MYNDKHVQLKKLEKIPDFSLPSAVSCEIGCKLRFFPLSGIISELRAALHGSNFIKIFARSSLF